MALSQEKDQDHHNDEQDGRLESSGNDHEETKVSRGSQNQKRGRRDQPLSIEGE